MELNATQISLLKHHGRTIKGAFTCGKGNYYYGCVSEEDYKILSELDSVFKGDSIKLLPENYVNLRGLTLSRKHDTNALILSFQNLSPVSYTVNFEQEGCYINNVLIEQITSIIRNGAVYQKSVYFIHVVSRPTYRLSDEIDENINHALTIAGNQIIDSSKQVIMNFGTCKILIKMVIDNRLLATTKAFEYIPKPIIDNQYILVCLDKRSTNIRTLLLYKTIAGKFQPSFTTTALESKVSNCDCKLNNIDTELKSIKELLKDKPTQRNEPYPTYTPSHPYYNHPRS